MFQLIHGKWSMRKIKSIYNDLRGMKVVTLKL